MTSLSELLLESHRMYGNLDLMDNFGQIGKSRSAWRLSQIMQPLGRDDEATIYASEANTTREALGCEPKHNLVEADFNVLLNTMDT